MDEKDQLLNSHIPWVIKDQTVKKGLEALDEALVFIIKISLERTSRRNHWENFWVWVNGREWDTFER